MRAAQLTGWRAPLDIVDLPDPSPPPGGVVLRTLASGVCRSDWHAWTGADPDVALPHVPGHEFCGEVVAVDRAVTQWSVGDRVIAPFILACGHCPSCQRGEQTICPDQAVPGFTIPGSFAEMIAIPFADTNLAPLPDSMPPALAAAMGCRITTAWQALTARAAVQPGEWVAIFGGGGIGLSTQLLAQALGARVVVVDIAPEKLQYAKGLGAEVVVDARAGDAAQAVRDATQGGAHVAIEALGIEDTTAGAMRALRKLGRMVQIGMPAGDHAQMTLPMDALYSGQLTVYGTRGMPAWRYPQLFDFIAAKGLDLSPLIARKVRLSDATDELCAFDAPAPPGVAVITDFQS